MTDDAVVVVFPMGLFDRAASLEAIRESPPWSSVQLDSVRVTKPTPEVGVVTYRAVANREGSDPYEAWMSSTYLRDGAGNWRLALHQQSPG